MLKRWHSAGSILQTRASNSMGTLVALGSQYMNGGADVVNEIIFPTVRDLLSQEISDRTCINYSDLIWFTLQVGRAIDISEADVWTYFKTFIPAIEAVHAPRLLALPLLDQGDNSEDVCTITSFLAEVVKAIDGKRLTSKQVQTFMKLGSMGKGEEAVYLSHAKLREAGFQKDSEVLLFKLTDIRSAIGSANVGRKRQSRILFKGTAKCYDDIGETKA
eukprot:m.294543 g.294543  ORF g.294543 m.294543 type:complete len:218 (+) comp40749_c1_seq29:1075-1728(+)